MSPYLISISVLLSRHNVLYEDTVHVLYENNVSCCNQRIFIAPQNKSNRKSNRSNVTVLGDNSNRSNGTVPTGDKKNITNKVHEGGGNEGTVDSKNANKCKGLLIGHKGIKIEGKVCFKIGNNRNGLACSDSNSYWKSGRVGESRGP